jgi:hypothetical protein
MKNALQAIEINRKRNFSLQAAPQGGDQAAPMLAEKRPKVKSLARRRRR